MFVPLTINDFLDRAAQVYPDRVALVDEPDQPATPLEPWSYRRFAAAAASQAAGLDRLGVPVGGRVAIVSHNSGRLLTSFFGVSGSGRVLVPVNFRLAPAEVEYIVGHSGAEVLFIDPELTSLLDTVRVPHNIRPGGVRRRVLLRARRRTALGRRRGRDGDDQLHLRHDRAPEGRPADAPQPVAQRRDVRDAHDAVRP